MAEPIERRYEFLLLFDVENGNPNGDPDGDNQPRMDFETGTGWVSDVSLKRKIRNYVALKHRNQSPYRIYVTERAILENFHLEAHRETGSAVAGREEAAGGKKAKRQGTVDEVETARKWMCENFFDIRTFGAVMSTGINAGQVRGPVQLSFARSIDPIEPVEQTITRMAVATQKESDQQQGDNRTMGRKWVVPYGLYRAEGFISAFFAEDTGFSEDDLSLLWEALVTMFEHDRSAARGKMSTRKLFVFRHESPLGNAPAHKLFDLVSVRRSGDPSEVERAPARAFDDYGVDVRREDVPSGVELMELV
ncbi:MAG: type I-C CRISPR-associated protein Cas7/Csd2 [Spirochaetia bacterium]